MRTRDKTNRTAVAMLVLLSFVFITALVLAPAAYAATHTVLAESGSSTT